MPIVQTANGGTVETDASGHPLGAPTPPVSPGNSRDEQIARANSMGLNNNVPRVTPNIPAGGSTPNPGTPASTPVTPPGGTSGGYTPPPPPQQPESEDQVYQKLVDRSSNLIADSKKTYDDEIDRAHGVAGASIAASGLAGSSVAPGIDEAAVKPLIEQRDKELAGIYDSIQKNADVLYQQGVENTRQTNQDTIAAQDRARGIAQDNIKTLAANHIDWQNYKQTNPDNYKALVDSLGGDANVADALFASSIPKANITQSWVNGSTYSQLSVDPITGKPSIQTYDLGVKVPQNWTQEKISNNAVIYHDSNWDPSDPSTYQIFSVDPLTGLPTGQVGGNTNPTLGDNTVKTISNILSQNGITVDPQAPIDTAHVPEITNAIIQNENSKIDPSFNNPGDIKFANLPGQTDSGVKASDGGTWAKYESKEAGTQAVSDLVKRAATKGTSFSDFIKSYTGTGSTSTSAQNQAIQSWVNNIKNGNATLTNVPAGARTAVSNALDQSDTGSYTPLADARYTTAANRIVSNFVQMPAYQLTAGGQLYLGRINAALKTPGSVSDQDLLDSLTKLNTGGNAISDAQVKLITDGKSYSDWKNTVANKFANGGVLSDNQRKQIQTLAQNIFKSYQDAYQPIYEQATKQLQEAGIPKPFWTIPDLNTLTTQSGTGDDSGAKGPDINSPEWMSSYNYDKDIADAKEAIAQGAPADQIKQILLKKYKDVQL